MFSCQRCQDKKKRLQFSYTINIHVALLITTSENVILKKQEKFITMNFSLLMHFPYQNLEQFSGVSIRSICYQHTALK